MCCLGCCSSDDSSHHDLALNKERRSCTDVGFLLIFFLFCCGLGTTTWYAISRGDPYRIMYGSDSFGNTCGRPNSRLVVRVGETSESREFDLSGQDMTDKRYMFPLNITNPVDTVWNCVRECPQKTLATAAEVVEEAEKNNNSLCISLDESLQKDRRFDVCPKLPVHKSISIVNRCIPEDIITLGQELATKVIEMDFIRGYLSEVVVTAPFILKMSAIAFVLSIVSVYILRFFAPVLIYFIYILVVIVSIGISGALWYSVYLISFKENVTSEEVAPTPAPTEFSPQVAHLMKLGEGKIDSWLDMENTSQLTAVGLALGASVITIFVAFVVWCLLPRGQKMIRLFKKASMALAAMPILLLQPITTSIFIIIIALYSISTCFLLYTAGESVSRAVSDGSGNIITIIETNMTETTRMMLIYQLVGFVWLSEFVLACQRLFIAGCISRWYFDRRAKSGSYLCASFGNTVRYHLGSAALGSFIITLIRLPRCVLMYIYAKMKAVENPLAKKLLACFICILSCIDRCLSYITYNAYTVIAYSGMSFCPSAKTAVNTLLDNAVDVTTLNTVGDAVLYLTKFMVSAITATIAGYQIQSLKLNHPWLPVLLVFFCSYLIANCFLSVYEMTLDTLFLCCAEEADLSKENPNNQYSDHEFRDLVSSASGSSHSQRVRGDASAESMPLRRM